MVLEFETLKFFLVQPSLVWTWDIFRIFWNFTTRHLYFETLKLEKIVLLVLLLARFLQKLPMSILILLLTLTLNLKLIMVICSPVKFQTLKSLHLCQIGRVHLIMTLSLLPKLKLLNLVNQALTC